MTIKDLMPKFNRRGDRAPRRRAEEDFFRGLRRELDRLVDDFYADYSLARWPVAGEQLAAGFLPRVDVSETDREVKISAELPGLSEQDIAVELDEHTVTIRGEKKEEREQKEQRWYRREQACGSFQRVIALPEGSQPDAARATFKQGLLTITLPKQAGAGSQRKVIPITTDED